MPVFITKLTTNASRYINGRITKSIPDSLDRSGDVVLGSTLITSTLGFAGVVLRVLLLRGVVGVVNVEIIINDERKQKRSNDNVGLTHLGFT
jgi:hypothetical protein